MRVKSKVDHHLTDRSILVLCVDIEVEHQLHPFLMIFLTGMGCIAIAICHTHCTRLLVIRRGLPQELCSKGQTCSIFKNERMTEQVDIDSEVGVGAALDTRAGWQGLEEDQMLREYLTVPGAL